MDTASSSLATTGALPLRRWLAAATSMMRPPSPRTGRLGVDGLPDDWAWIENGKLYAVYATGGTPAADALIWASVRAAQSRHVTVVLARERDAVIARLRELGFDDDRPARGWPRGLNVLAMPPEAAHAEHGARPVAFARLIGALQALRRLGVRRRALYIIEGGERWFSWSDPVALAREGRALAGWCAARRIAMVLLLDAEAAQAASRSSDAASHGLSQTDGMDDASDGLAALAGRPEFHAACAGVARVQHTHGELLWHGDFWRSGETLVTGERLGLRFSEAGRLAVAPVTADAWEVDGDVLLARDDARVVVTRAAVHGEERWLPPHWEIIEDQRSLLAACGGAQAATVLLDYRGSADLEPLCSTVHALRRRCGRALKIAVVERGEVLRHQYELLVLNLGANLVLGRELPFSRIQSLLHSLQGQLHTRPVAVDYRAALAAALSDSGSGYLPVGEFCERLRTTVARGAPLKLPHVLVKLRLAPGRAHGEALRHCMPRRSGDVLTLDASHLYLFLFACRPADVDRALANIVDVPVDQLAERVERFTEDAIDAELRDLEAANRRTRFAEYSDVYPTVPRSVPSPSTAEGVDRPRQAGEESHTTADQPDAANMRAQTSASAKSQSSDRALVPPRPRRAVRAAMPVLIREKA